MNSASQRTHGAQPSTGARPRRHAVRGGRAARSSHALFEIQEKARCSRWVSPRAFNLRKCRERRGTVALRHCPPTAQTPPNCTRPTSTHGDSRRERSEPFRAKFPRVGVQGRVRLKVIANVAPRVRIPPSSLIFPNRCRYFKPQRSERCPPAAQTCCPLLLSARASPSNGRTTRSHLPTVPRQLTTPT